MTVKADKILAEAYPDKDPNMNIFGGCDAIYITSKDGKIKVLSGEDMQKIVAERARREAVPLDQLKHRENMGESTGPATR
jgi:topoisomerase IA-like protein